MMNALIVKSALHYVEFTSVVAVLVVLVCALLAYRISVRRPLYYNLFVVEMHTWTNRRMVQVLHLGQEFHPTTPWDRLVQRMRARAPRIQGEQRIAISDTNIVIQSPNTVIDSPAPARAPDVDRITLWDIEMPPPHPNHVPDATRDSQYAAAAAIAILARGDDNVLRSRVFQNSDNRSMDDTLEEGRPRGGPNPMFPAGFVTTDVTYTTPTLNDPVVPAGGSERMIEYDVRDSDDDLPYEPSDESSEEDVDEVVIDGLNWSDGEEEEETEEARAVREFEEHPNLIVIGSESDVIPGVIEMGREYDVYYPDDSSDDEETEQKGSSKTEEPKVLIRLKFMNDTEKDAFSSLEDSIAKFKGDHFPDIQENQVIRLIFQGQLLREDRKTLKDYGVVAGSVVHCHISTTPFDAPRAAQPPAPVLHRTTRPRRVPRVPRAPRAVNPAGPLPIVVETNDPVGIDDLGLRRAQDRNVGHVFMVLSAIAPVLSAIGLRFFRGNQVRQLFRPATLLTLSHWICNLLVENGLLEQPVADAEDGEHLQTSTLFWIFSGQVLAVSIFFYYFPDIYDRVGFSILGIVGLYFIFVIFSRQRRRQPEPVPPAQRNNVIQETITLM